MATKTYRVRVPARVQLFISGTDWYQKERQYPEPVYRTYRDQDTRDNHRADGSLAVEGDIEFMAMLYEEADFALDAASHGDNSTDDLADQNAAKALMRRIRNLGLYPRHDAAGHMTLVEA